MCEERDRVPIREEGRDKREEEKKKTKRRLGQAETKRQLLLEPPPKTNRPKSKTAEVSLSADHLSSLPLWGSCIFYYEIKPHSTYNTGRFLRYMYLIVISQSSVKTVDLQHMLHI